MMKQNEREVELNKRLSYLIDELNKVKKNIEKDLKTANKLANEIKSLELQLISNE